MRLPLHSRSARRATRTGTVVSFLIVTGCIFDPKDRDGDRDFELPLADSPPHAMARFEGVYESQNLAEYEALLAADFRFRFSSQTDPELVTRYGENWSKPDEIESARHLFEGFTGASGFQPGATRIVMTQNAPTFGDHPSFDPDSLAYYEWVVVPRLVLEIEVPGSPDPVIYEIDSRQEFYLVRGDAALLDPGQEPRSDRWYIYRWDDLAQPLAAPDHPVTFDPRLL